MKYCFSQDGVKWVDLEGLSEETAANAAPITGMLSGEPAKAYAVATPGAPPPEEGQVQSCLHCTQLNAITSHPTERHSQQALETLLHAVQRLLEGH